MKPSWNPVALVTKNGRLMEKSACGICKPSCVVYTSLDADPPVICPKTDVETEVVYPSA